jgi:signal transduction histidine kinase/ligand-binding sensor domain-containing protein
LSRSCACALIGGFAASSASVLAATPAIELYVARAWTIDQGLPHDTLSAIAQTADGFLWVGTQDGLARFDGTSFNVFRGGALDDLRNEIITDLVRGHDGSLWIGTVDSGLYRLRGGELTQYGLADGLADQEIVDLEPDSAGGIWIGTRFGLAYGIDGAFTAYSYPAQDVRYSGVVALLVTSDGAVWAAGDRGLARKSGDRFVAVNAFYDRSIRCFHEDSAGRVWIGMLEGEILMLPDAGSAEWTEAYGLQQGLRDEQVRSILEDSQGTLWVAMSSALLRLSGDRFEAITDINGVRVERVYSLFEDREQNLWLATMSDGLVQFRARALMPYSAREGLGRDVVFSIAEDAAGSTWIGTMGGGLARIERGRVTKVYTTADGLASDSVSAVFSDRGPDVWIAFFTGGGRWRGGIQQYSEGRFRTPNWAEALPRETLYALARDRTGRLWIGGDLGLYWVEHEQLNRFTGDLGQGFVHAIAAGRDDTVWVGTEAGLYAVRDGTVVEDPRTTPLAAERVWTIHEDAEGVLWIGTDRGGLHRISRDGHFSFTTQHGLSSNEVYQLLEDDDRTFWMSSSKGIFKVPKDELDGVAARREGRLSVRMYGRSDGMKRSEGVGSVQPGAWRASDGTLWFPTTGGAVAIVPSMIAGRQNKVPPQVHIERVRADGRLLDFFEARDELIIPPGRGALEIDYVAPSFDAPERVTHTYRLDGFDTDWIQAGPRRSAYYTNVPPGSYTFRVRAKNSDGLASREDAVMKIVLEARFYQTALFKALMIVVFAAALWLTIRRRTRRLIADATLLADERARLARDIHDGLTQSLTGILIQLEAASELFQRAPETTFEHIERAKNWARMSLAEARRAVWALRADETSVSALADVLRRAAEVLSTSGRTKVDVVAPEDCPLTSEVSTALLRIGQEAVSNAVRHAAPSQVHVELRVRSDGVSLRVEDDGSGFRPELAEGAGLGLRSMRERAEAIGARFTVSSELGAGSVITADVPLLRRGVSSS